MKILRDKTYKFIMQKMEWQKDRIEYLEGRLENQIKRTSELSKIVDEKDNYIKHILTKLDNTKKELHDTREELKSAYGRLGGKTKALNKYKKKVG